MTFTPLALPSRKSGPSALEVAPKLAPYTEFQETAEITVGKDPRGLSSCRPWVFLEVRHLTP